MIKISLMDLPGQYQLVTKKIKPALERVLASGRYILGPEVKKFEENFAKFCQAKYCVTTSSGTDSLYLSLLALNIGPGDEVITVPNTFTATAEVIALTGARPVFCDVDSKTYLMDPKSLSSKITKKTKAVIPVHLHGNPVDLEAIYKITKPRKIAVVEDAAQGHGSKYQGGMIGSSKSELICFSFHPVKNLGAFGDGGAVTTNSARLAKLVRLLSTHGRESHNEHIIIGTTARLDSLQAAILDIKLKYLNRWIKSKKRLAKYYQKKLSKYVNLMEEVPGTESAYHVIAILAQQRDKLAKFLQGNGIETGMHYPIPLHLQPAYKYLDYKRGDFPNAEKYAQQTLSLPLFPHMNKKQVNYVIEKIQEFYDKR